MRRNNRKYINAKKGVTLIELLVVIGIIGMVAAGGFMALRQMKNQIALDKAASDVYTALQKAQSLSASGFGTTKHGVHIGKHSIFIFDGDSYVDGTGEEVNLPAGTSTDADEDGIDIVFDRLISTTTSAIDDIINISLISGGGSKKITIETNGKIILE